MFGNSPQIESSQTGVHPRLLDVLRRHREHPWRAPLHAPTQVQCQRWLTDAADHSRPLLLDLGCGNGESTLRLAELHPDAHVLGIDQSAHRLTKLAPDGYAVHGGATLMRAEAASVVRLLAAAAIPVRTLYLLYPNPWPKPEQLQRRWHGHPVLPVLLAIAESIVLRTNWSIYAEEFALTVRACGLSATTRMLDAGDAAWTPFEAKYIASGHARHQVSVSRCMTSVKTLP